MTRIAADMRIAIVTDTFPPDVNGVAMTLERLAAGLTAAGHEVEVIHPGIREPGPGEPATGFREICVFGLPLPRYPFARLGLPRPVFLRRRWRQQRPDAVYVATEGLLGGSAVSAAKALGIPVVSGYHTHFPKYLSDYRLGLLEPVAVRYLRRMHNGTAFTLVPTAETARELEAQGFRRLRVLERGVDTALYHPARRSTALRERWGAAPEDPVLLYTGRVAAEKGLPLVFASWRMLREHWPKAKLVIVGDGPVRPAMEAAHPDAIWTGFLNGVDLAEAYASSDLFLFPSRTETFGNVLLEAMASGMVTVSWHLAASRRFVVPGENGYAAGGGDDDAFLRQVLRAMRERHRWARLGEAARQTLRHQSWQSVTARFAAILAEAATPVPVAA